LGRDANGLVQANRRDTGSFLAQDVSDLHRNLLQVNRRGVFSSERLVYIMPIVN
jgi:hypothetical protein